MNATGHPAHASPFQRRWLAAILALISILAACGGSGSGLGGIADVGSGGTGAAFTGPISGFGSVILNGVRFDDSAARIILDDDNTSAKSADLKLGMMVDIEGKQDANGLTGKAATISGRSYVQGPVSAIDAAAGQLTVLGLKVAIVSSTVLDGPGVSALANLRANDVVEIYGIADGAGGLIATRIEKKPATDEVRIVGVTQETSATQFRLNGITVQYRPSNLFGSDGRLSDGNLVRVKGVLLEPDRVIASSVREVALTPAPREGLRFEVEGVVTRFDMPAEFELNGLKVNIAGLTNRQSTLALGRRIEVEGIVINNVLVANRIEVKDEKDERNEANQLIGAIDSIDPATQSFTMRNGTIKVKWDDKTKFDSAMLPRGGASFTAGLRVEVKGKVVGNILQASKIGPAK